MISKTKLVSNVCDKITNFSYIKDQKEDMNNKNYKNSIESKVKSLLKDPILDVSEQKSYNNLSDILGKSDIETVDTTNKSLKNVRKTVVSKFFNETLQDFEIPLIDYQNFNTISEKKKNCSKRKNQTQLNNGCRRKNNSHENFECHTLEKSTEIRKKLQQYDFKSNHSDKDNNIQYFLPKRNKKAKWSNKYTPLTCRCPEYQKKKLDVKIQKFLDSQFTQSENFYDLPFEYKICSPYLKTLIPEIETVTYFNNCMYVNKSTDDLEIFYVTELMESKKNKLGSLLKNYRDIPGRINSPERRNVKCENTLHEIININAEEALEDSKTDSNLNVKSLHCEKLENEYLKKTSIDIDPLYTKNISKLSEIEFSNPDVMQKNLFESDIRESSPDIFNLSDEGLVEKNDICLEVKSSKNNNFIYENLFKETNNFVCTKTKFKDQHSSSESENIMTYEIFSSDEEKVSENINDIKNMLKSPNEAKQIKKNNEIEICNNSFINYQSINYDKVDILKTKLNDFTVKSDSSIILSDNEVNYSPTNSYKKGILEKYDKKIYNINQEVIANESGAKLLISDFIDKVEKDSDHVSKCETMFTKCVESKKTEEKVIFNQNENETGKFLTLSDNEEDMFNLRNLQQKYGILNSKKIDNTQNSGLKKSLSESFVKMSNFPRFSRSKNQTKFYNNEVSDKKSKSFNKQNSFQEFDKLDYGVSFTKSQVPTDFEKLLTKDINIYLPNNSLQNVSNEFEFINDKKIYIIRNKNVQVKPDFERMDSPTRMKLLYNFGLKPLKKKQAIKILEYIYNQTHPFILENTHSSLAIKDKLVESNINLNNLNIKNRISNISSSNELTIKDCFWEELSDNDYKPIFEENEKFTFQKNVKKNIATALLPFNVAWFNLVKSNKKLREAILHFEPINLKKIYIFLKSIGYRYNPKEMKRFLDFKCVIFYYESNSNKKVNRCSRK